MEEKRFLSADGQFELVLLANGSLGIYAAKQTQWGPKGTLLHGGVPEGGLSPSFLQQWGFDQAAVNEAMSRQNTYLGDTDQPLAPDQAAPDQATPGGDAAQPIVAATPPADNTPIGGNTPVTGNTDGAGGPQWKEGDVRPKSGIVGKYEVLRGGQWVESDQHGQPLQQAAAPNIPAPTFDSLKGFGGWRSLGVGQGQQQQGQQQQDQSDSGFRSLAGFGGAASLGFGQPESDFGTIYEEITPSDAFERYLYELEGQRGGRFSDRVRAGLERRGGYLSALAPLFGVGAPVDGGGTGQTLGDYFNTSQGRLPSYQSTGDALRALHTIQQNPQASYSDMGRLEQFDNPSEQLGLLQAHAVSRFAPYLQAGYARALGRGFQRQSLTDPNFGWLQYGKSQGLF